jgi:hypothetical protein
MSEGQTVEDLTPEQLVEYATQLTQEVTNLRQNQQALVTENNQMRKAVTEKKDGPLIFSKMLAIKQDLDAIGKGQKNAMQGWNFRGIDDFMNALKPITDKHGVFVTPKTLNASEPVVYTNAKGKSIKYSNIIMEYVFFAEDGSHVSASVPAEAQDSGDKGVNKALSAAFKYALMQTFVCPTKDIEEGDKDVVELGKAPKKAAVKEDPYDPFEAEAAPAEKAEAAPAEKPKRVVRKKKVAKSVAAEVVAEQASPEEKTVEAKSTPVASGKKVAKKRSFRKGAAAGASQ